MGENAFDWEREFGGFMTPQEAIEVCRRDGISFQEWAEIVAVSYEDTGDGDPAPDYLIPGMLAVMEETARSL